MARTLKKRPDWKVALAITVGLRGIYSAAAAAGAVLLHPDPRLVQSNAFTDHLPAPHGWHYALLGVWERFDTLWYLHIAERGYDSPAAVVFYPLYPLLIRWMGTVTGPIAAALILSTAAAFFYFWGLLRIGATEESGGSRWIALAAVWPASFFLFAGYTEALAMALILWSVIFAREDNWLEAAACGLAAGLARSAGTLVLVPLVVLAWRSSKPQRWLAAIAPMGTLGYWIWLHQTGRPSIPTAYRLFWATNVAPPWTTLSEAVRSLGHDFDGLVVLNLLAVIAFVLAGIARRRRVEDQCFSVAVVLHLLLRMCSPPLLGSFRYLLPVYPAFLTFGDWTKGLKRGTFVVVCLGLGAFNLVWMCAFLRWSLVL